MDANRATKLTSQRAAPTITGSQEIFDEEDEEDVPGTAGGALPVLEKVAVKGWKERTERE
ncbi:hypothetical protein HDU93_001559, partial [Gonapodya sp. JEL0774]